MSAPAPRQERGEGEEGTIAAGEDADLAGESAEQLAIGAMAPEGQTGRAFLRGNPCPGRLTTDDLTQSFAAQNSQIAGLSRHTPGQAFEARSWWPSAELAAKLAFYLTHQEPFRRSIYRSWIKEADDQDPCPCRGAGQGQAKKDPLGGTPESQSRPIAFLRANFTGASMPFLMTNCLTRPSASSLATAPAAMLIETPIQAV